MRQKLMQGISDCIRAAEVLQKKESIVFIETAAQKIANCFILGGKLLIAGNGGSLCDADHFAEELTGFFRKPRRALPAIALSHPGHLSCVGNDVGFEHVFARGVEAFGQPNDLFIGLTTSGNSQNLVRAFNTASLRNIQTIAFLGKEGGLLRGVADLEWIVEGFSTSDRIQEAHMAAIHLIIEQVEYRLQGHEAAQSLQAALL